MSDKIGRNDPCPCGSGLKYKKCCLNKGSNAAVVKLACYVEEYAHPAHGRVCARLRDKKTNKKVCLLTDDPMMHSRLLAFLSQARAQHAIMPTIFDRDGTDIVAVRGVIVNETDEDIDVNIYVPTGGFLFE